MIWSRTLELFDRMGCSGEFLAGGIRSHGASMRHGSAVLGEARFDSIPSAYNFGLMIPQRATERLMTDHLGTFGIHVRREVELIRFDALTDHVEATLRHADGQEKTVVARWLVGCDGAHSTRPPPARRGPLTASRKATTGSWPMCGCRATARRPMTR